MSLGRWVRLLCTAAVTLAGSAAVAAPAVAAPAPPCPAGNCVRYWADLTITAWASPSTPVHGIPTSSTLLVSFPFLAPFEPGTYTTAFSVYAFNFTEYNVNNNTFAVTYQAGYPA
ncbi:hypothetical protein AB0K00_51445 [Dactylosporangium sp. NPDC049525]|uniref:hypothetical protein n=1 Tax=Dactylosporangium sp. NPDC049525 TaxID=3154730 RepID=UPI003443E06F